LKKILAVLGFLILALGGLTAGCGGGKDEKAVYKAVLKDELVVATEAAFAPFEFYDEKNQQMIGFDVDLIRALAKEIGYKNCTIRHMDFDDLIPAVNSDKADVAISAVSITETRKRVVLFSQPYYKSGLAFIVKKDITDVKAFEDLKSKTIAVQKDTTGDVYAQQLKDKGAVIKAFETNDQALMALKNGKADAVVCDLPVLQYYLTKGGSTFAKLVGQPLTAEEYGIITGKKKPEMEKAVNKALESLKRNGTYDKIYDKWFGKGQK
jgi:polar amino acid transport system substrate-binding protein